MTLNQIFDEQAYGKEYVKFKTIKEGIEKNYDRETGIFKASGRIQDLVEDLEMKDSDKRLFNHICSKCESIEARLFNEDDMSKNYKSVMGISIVEDCNNLLLATNKRGSYEAIPSKENYAKAIATAKYFVESYLMDNAPFKESKSVAFNNMIEEEEDNIKQVL